MIIRNVAIHDLLSDLYEKLAIMAISFLDRLYDNEKAK